MPDVTQASGLFWATVFGAAVGVVAGTVIQYLLTVFLHRQTRKRQKSALSKELAYNKSLIDELTEEARRLRNAVNGDALNAYFGHFGFGRAIFAQANASTMNGTLYEVFSIDEIRCAQRMVSLLSAGTETWINAEIKRRRDLVISVSEEFNKPEAVQFVDFVESQIREADRSIQTLARAIQ